MPDEYQEAMRDLADYVEKIIGDVGQTTTEIYKRMENDRYAPNWDFAEFHVLKALQKLLKRGRAYCYFLKKDGETVRYWRRPKRRSAGK